jgi:hypothetical protein
MSLPNSFYYREWRTWKNGDSFTGTFRTHLKACHLDEYESIVRLLKLKHAAELDNLDGSPLVDNGPFQLKEWIRRLIKWVVVDDQV